MPGTSRAHIEMWNGHSSSDAFAAGVAVMGASQLLSCVLALGEYVWEEGRRVSSHDPHGQGTGFEKAPANGSKQIAATQGPLSWLDSVYLLLPEYKDPSSPVLRLHTTSSFSRHPSSDYLLSSTSSTVLPRRSTLKPHGACPPHFSSLTSLQSW